MATCIEIEISDQGAVTVGVCPPEPVEETGAQKEYMQPAASVDEALAKAKQLLSGGQPDQAKQIATGYARAKGPGLM